MQDARWRIAIDRLNRKHFANLPSSKLTLCFKLYTLFITEKNCNQTETTCSVLTFESVCPSVRSSLRPCVTKN